MRRRILEVIILSLTAATANAALVGRLPLTPGGTDYEAIYDTDLDITWLADANLPWTSTFGVSGITNSYMNWYTAQSWLGAVNAASYLGVNDWRLPTTTQPDPTCQLQYDFGGTLPPQGYGHGCTGSEFGHLFYDELGGVVGSDIGTTHNANYALFRNIQLDWYWSGTTYEPDTTAAWSFYFTFGAQDAVNKEYNFWHVWAVRDGDIAAVPIPAALWLLGSALGVMGVARRRAAV